MSQQNSNNLPFASHFVHRRRRPRRSFAALAQALDAKSKKRERPRRSRWRPQGKMIFQWSTLTFFIVTLGWQLKPGFASRQLDYPLVYNRQQIKQDSKKAVMHDELLVRRWHCQSPLMECDSMFREALRAEAATDEGSLPAQNECRKAIEYFKLGPHFEG